LNDVRQRQVANLDFNSDRNTIHVCAYVRSHVAKASLKLHVRNVRCICETHPNFRFAAAVILAFAEVIATDSIWRMGEVFEASPPAS
jgi:hypothetical protein